MTPTAINIVRPRLPDLAGIAPALAEALASGMVTNNGPHVREFEAAVQAFLGSSAEVAAFANGELALYNTILCWKHYLGYGPHDSFEVLVPSLTFSGTVNAIAANNLKPVFCDVDETLTMDPAKLEATGDVRMMIPVAVYGNLPDIDRLHEFAHSHDLVTIYDNAPAFGARYAGQFPCHRNIEEIYSFHATKPFCCMEGGAAISHNPDIRSLLQRSRDFGQYEKSRGNVDLPALNAKMQEVSAMVGRRNLEDFADVLTRRSRIAARYDEHFAQLETLCGIKRMHVPQSNSCLYLYYPLILPGTPEPFIDFLSENGITARRYYTATHTLDFYAGRYRHLDLTTTESIMDRLVALPLHSDMTDAEIDWLLSRTQLFFEQE